MAGSSTHQALLHAATAIEQLAAGDPSGATHSVSRGYERIAVPVPTGGVLRQLEHLIDTVYDADDGEALLAADLRGLMREKLR